MAKAPTAYVLDLGEVYSIAQRERGRDKAVEMLVFIDQLPIRQEPVDRTLVLSAESIKANNAIFYANAFAAGLAQPACDRRLRRKTPIATHSHGLS